MCYLFLLSKVTLYFIVLRKNLIQTLSFPWQLGQQHTTKEQTWWLGSVLYPKLHWDLGGPVEVVNCTSVQSFRFGFATGCMWNLTWTFKNTIFLFIEEIHRQQLYSKGQPGRHENVCYWDWVFFFFWFSRGWARTFVFSQHRSSKDWLSKETNLKRDVSEGQVESWIMFLFTSSQHGSRNWTERLWVLPKLNFCWCGLLPNMRCFWGKERRTKRERIWLWMLLTPRHTHIIILLY